MALFITYLLCAQIVWSTEHKSIIDQANSPEHIAAIDRTRRIIKHFDLIHANPAFAGTNSDVLVKFKFDFIDSGGTQIDSVFWDWSEGNTVPFPSKVIPGFNSAGFKKWYREGTDIVRVFLEETKKRGLETFYSYRINGSDSEPDYTGTIPFKKAHPEWLLDSFWTYHDTPKRRYLDFSNPQVRELKLRILQEIAETYDFDGIQIDFARTPLLLPAGRQWEMRNDLTNFMRSVRRMMFDVAKKRGRPLLLAVKIPENIQGCHLDGIDIETWVSEQLADLLILGVRSTNVDIQAFRRRTTGTNIKLYPCFDDAHGSDGYAGPSISIEVIRGVYTNWWSQGADGVCTFNWPYARKEAANFARLAVNLSGEQLMETYLQAYREIGDPEILAAQDKAFVVQRRGGGHSNVPSPDDWHTPRAYYFNTNAFGQLPVELDNQSKVDALITLRISDKLAAAADRISDLTMRVLLSDPGAKSLSEKQTVRRTEIRRYYGGWVRYNTPPSKDIVKHLEVRLNGGLLREPKVKNGWLVFRPDPKQFAMGENLIGMVLKGSPGTTSDHKLPPQWWADLNELEIKAAKTVPYRGPGSPSVTLEKLEVHVKYRRP